MTSGEIWEWCASSSKLIAVFLLIQNDLDFGKLFLGKNTGLILLLEMAFFHASFPLESVKKYGAATKSVAVFGGIS